IDASSCVLLRCLSKLLCFSSPISSPVPFISFFFNDPATTEIYTLSLHDALPISVGPARLRGDPRQPAGHPDRGVAPLRAAAVPAGRGRPHPRAEARRGRLPEPGGDGGDARGRSGAAVRRRDRTSGGRGCAGRGRASRRRACRRSRPPGGRVVPAGDRGAARRRLGGLRRAPFPPGGGAAPAAGGTRGPSALVAPSPPPTPSGPPIPPP